MIRNTEPPENEAGKWWYDAATKKWYTIGETIEPDRERKIREAAPDMYELLLDMNIEGGHGLRVHERIRNILNRIEL